MEVAELQAAMERAWGGLEHRHNGYPRAIDKLLARIDLWLDGEDAVFIEFGWDEARADGSTAFSVSESDRMWVTVLTERFALRVVIGRQPDSAYLGSVRDWTLVERRKLVELEPLMSGNEWERGLRFRVRFEGLAETLEMPSSWDSTSSVGDDRAFFRSLRDDLYAE